MDDHKNLEITLKITIDPNNEMSKIIEMKTESKDKVKSVADQIMAVIHNEQDIINEEALSMKNLDKALLDEHAKNNVFYKEEELRIQQFFLQKLLKRIKLVIPQ